MRSMGRSAIRLASARDAPEIAAIYGPHCEQTTVSFEVTAPAPGEMAERVERITDWYPWLVLDLEDVVAGYAYASRHHERAAYQWGVNVTVYVSAAHHRKGAGRALYTALFGMLRALGYFKAYAGVSLPNPGSVGLHESMGFSRIGVYRGVGYKFGKWLDVAWFDLELLPERPGPPPTRNVRDIVDGPVWRQAIADGLQRLTLR